MEKASGNPKCEKDKFLIMKKITMDTSKYFKMKNSQLMYQKHISKILKGQILIILVFWLTECIPKFYLKLLTSASTSNNE